MKLTNRDFAAKGRSAAQGCSIFFFCGQDEAGATAAANDLVTWLPEPGERLEMSGGEVKNDPAKLGDEARTNSLFGDKRHIWIRANGDEAAEALKVLIETSDAGAGEACPVIVVATSATDKSRTAKLLDCLEAAESAHVRGEMGERQPALVRRTDCVGPGVTCDRHDALHVALLRRHVGGSRAVGLRGREAGEGSALCERIEHLCLPLLAREARGGAAGFVRCG